MIAATSFSAARRATPGRSLSFNVRCASTAGGADYVVHPVTLNPDWTLVTPHHLEAERLGVAFGGYCDCLTLIDHGIPAAQEWLGLHLRRRLPPLTYSNQVGWRLLKRDDCCILGTRDWVDVDDLVSHLAGVTHLATEYGACRHHVDAITSALAIAWRSQVDAERSEPALAEAMRDPDGPAALWRVGLHPRVALDMLSAIPSATGRVPMEFFIGLAYVPLSPAHLLELAGQRDPTEAAWLIWSHVSEAPRQPLEFARMLTTCRGDRWLAKAIMDAGYTTEDLEEIATGQFDGSSAHAAALLREWLSSGCRPSTADIHLAPGRPPEAEILDALMENARVRRSHMTRTQVALLWTAVRSISLLLDLIDDGVRSPRDVADWQSQRRDH